MSRPATLLPRPLPTHPVLGVCAPSGYLNEPGALDMAEIYFTERGYRVIEMPHTRGRLDYFSGADDDRLSDLHALVHNPEVDIIMPARGGYGLTRLLERLDYDGFARARKIIIGFSDITALHLALLAKTGLVTFAGPMVGPDFGHPHRSALHPNHFEGLLRTRLHCTPPIRFSAESHPIPLASTLQAALEGGIEGTLWGGNLSLVAHLVGTPYLPTIDDGLLFLEEVNEEPYIIERMLMQLYHAGILTHQRAILLGQFNRCEPTQHSAAAYTLARVIAFLRQLVTVPIIENLPFGHVRDKITVPVGGHGRIRVLDDQHYCIEFSHYLDL